jgi:hypothetical protein
MLINRNRLATYSNHAIVTHAVHAIISCHANKIVNVIQEYIILIIIMSDVLCLNVVNKPSSYSRMSQRFESIVNHGREIT